MTATDTQIYIMLLLGNLSETSQHFLIITLLALQNFHRPEHKIKTEYFKVFNQITVIKKSLFKEFL